MYGAGKGGFVVWMRIEKKRLALREREGKWNGEWGIGQWRWTSRSDDGENEQTLL